MSNVKNLFGQAVEVMKPNEGLVSALEQLLEMARTGQLQSYIGTGFTVDGLRATTWCNNHDDVCQMLGSIAWLQHEYVERTTASNNP